MCRKSREYCNFQSREAILSKFIGTIKVEDRDEAIWHNLIREDGTKHRGKLLLVVRKRTRFPPIYDLRRIARAAAISLAAVAAVIIVTTLLALMIPRGSGPSTRGAWRAEPPMLAPRAEAAAAVFAGRLHVIGGCCTLSSVESLSPAGSWRAEPPMLDARSRAGALKLDGALWAVGGMDRQSVETFNGSVWARRASLAARRGGTAAFMLNSSDAAAGPPRPCAFGREGGLGNSPPSMGAPGPFVSMAECLLSGPATETEASWGPAAAAAALPSDRVMFAASGFRGGLAVVGGWLGGPAGTLEIYDPVAAGWRRGPDMPTPRFALAAAEFAGRLFAVGGSAGRGPLAVVESFDGDAWITEPPLARPRQLLALVAFGDRLFALGGRGPGPAGAALSDVESYALQAPAA